MADEKPLLVSLDRIEEGIAVLITEDGQSWHVPESRMPDGSREGQLFDVIFRINQQETEDLSERIGDLQRALLRRTEERQREDPEE